MIKDSYIYICNFNLSFGDKCVNLKLIELDLTDLNIKNQDNHGVLTNQWKPV